MWDDARQLNFAAGALALVAVLAVVWAALAWALRQPPFAFREVIVHGPLERASAAYVEAAIREELTGTFFTMNLDRARNTLTRVPWVRNVALRREWPQRLEVTIEEHAPVARWNDAGLVNTQGEVFVANYNGELPQFDGPDGSAAQVAARYREWSEALAPLALTLERVRLSPRGGWRLAARGGSGALAIDLGRDEPTARLASFVGVYERTINALARAGTRVEHVDLRYRNGFAARVPGFQERAPKKKAGA
ncbi:MAG: cell division protein FtsQ/DivIB [Casimicrobiaceae bacterium]